MERRDVLKLLGSSTAIRAEKWPRISTRTGIVRSDPIQKTPGHRQRAGKHRRKGNAPFALWSNDEFVKKKGICDEPI